MAKYKCPRCEADPKPQRFGSPRNCAFTEDGAFTPDNWNCATICALMAAAGRREVEADGDNESLQVYPASPSLADDDGDWFVEPRGFIVLTRYKHRGCTSSAVYVGDFWPSEAVTLGLVEATIGTLLESQHGLSALSPSGGEVSDRRRTIMMRAGVLVGNSRRQDLPRSNQNADSLNEIRRTETDGR